MFVIRYYDILIWVAGITLFVITRSTVKDIEDKEAFKLKQEAKAEEIREYNRKRKEESDHNETN